MPGASVTDSEEPYLCNIWRKWNWFSYS